VIHAPAFLELLEGKTEKIFLFYQCCLSTHPCFQLDILSLAQAYKTAARKLAEKRIALAGARLAKILNEELR